MKKIMTILLVFSTVLFVSTASAVSSSGQYNFWEVLHNYTNPPRANNKVSSSQANREQFPLTKSDSAFTSNFRPNAYYQWQEITANEDETGAICGDGAPFTFMVNRSLNSQNIVIFMEGGALCLSDDTCPNPGGLAGANGPIGDLNSDMFKGRGDLGKLYLNSSPFTTRLSYHAQATNDWTKVFVPNCTADLYSGDTSKIIENGHTGETDSIELKGMRNIHAIVSWLKNNLQRPAQLLVTGRSAGGWGAQFNYAGIRNGLDPSYRGYMINDSGPLYPSLQEGVGGGSTSDPSASFYQAFRDFSKFDETSGKYLQSILPGFYPNDLGTLNTSLSEKWPNDRFGFTMYQHDGNIRNVMGFGSAPTPDEAQELQGESIQRMTHQLGSLANFGYYFPVYGISLPYTDSHSPGITGLTFLATIQEQNLGLKNFYDSVLKGKGSVMQAQEYDLLSDYEQIASIEGPLNEVIEAILNGLSF